MSLLGWLISGMIDGFIASRFVSRNAEGRVLDMMLAIVAVLAGGLVVCSVGPMALGGLNIYGIFIAAIGATGVLVLHDAAANRRRAI